MLIKSCLHLHLLVLSCTWRCLICYHYSVNCSVFQSIFILMVVVLSKGPLKKISWGGGGTKILPSIGRHPNYFCICHMYSVGYWQVASILLWHNTNITRWYEDWSNWLGEFVEVYHVMLLLPKNCLVFWEKTTMGLPGWCNITCWSS